MRDARGETAGDPGAVTKVAAVTLGYATWLFDRKLQ